MDWMILLSGFEFDDDLLPDDEVGAEAFIKRNTVDPNWDRHLAGDIESAFLQAVAKEDFVNRFEQAWAKLGVQLVGFIYDSATDFIRIHSKERLVSRGAAENAEGYQIFGPRVLRGSA